MGVLQSRSTYDEIDTKTELVNMLNGEGMYWIQRGILVNANYIHKTRQVLLYMLTRSVDESQDTYYRRVQDNRHDVETDIRRCFRQPTNLNSKRRQCAVQLYDVLIKDIELEHSAYLLKEFKQE